MKKRILWIDYIKLIGITLVVIAHVPQSESFEAWLCSFVLPIFFFASGLTLRVNLPFKEYILKRVKGLFVPYVIYSFVYIAYNVALIVVLNYTEISLTDKFIGMLIELRETPYSIGLWFIPLLFLADLEMYALLNGVKEKKHQGMILVLTMILGFGYAHFVGVALPWAMDAVFIVVPYIYLGYQFKEYYQDKEMKFDFKWMLVMFIINFLTNYVQYKQLGTCVDMYALRYGNPILYIISSVCGIMMIVILCSQYLNDLHSKVLAYVGRKTIHIYCMHPLVIIVLTKIIGSNYFDTLSGIALFLSSLLLTIATIVICTLIVYIFEKVNHKIKKIC